jgi:hypothetical protein
MHVVFYYPMHATFPAHPVLIDLIIIMFLEDYKVWSSLLWSFLQSPLITPLLVQISILISSPTHAVS